MYAIVIKAKNLRFTPEELKRKNKNFFITRYRNKEIIVLTKKEIDEKNIHHFVVEEEFPVPLYKQCMDMQMGKKTQKTTKDRRMYPFVKTTIVPSKMYEVYEEI